MRFESLENPRSLLLGAVLTGAALTLALATSQNGSPDATRSPAPSRLAETELPSPQARWVVPETTVPTALPVWSASLPDDATLTAEMRDAIQVEARMLGKTLPRGTSLRVELFARMARSPRCGRAHSAAVSGLFAEASPSEIESVLSSMKTTCDEGIVEAAGFSPMADASLANALARLAEGRSEAATRRAAWLSYGSLGETARRTGDVALAVAIEARILRALAPATGAERLLMVKTAGNAGCASCVPHLAKETSSPDLALRSAAVAAYRFVDEPGAVSAMCGALGADREDAVRDMAAWALEWRGGAAVERAACLEKAARGDASQRVRTQATLALGVLADEHRSARASLEHLAAEPRLDMQSLAAHALELRGMAPAPLLASLEE